MGFCSVEAFQLVVFLLLVFVGFWFGFSLSFSKLPYMYRHATEFCEFLLLIREVEIVMSRQDSSKFISSVSIHLETNHITLIHRDMRVKQL